MYDYVAKESATQIDESLRDVASAFARLWRSGSTATNNANADDVIKTARADNFEFVVVDETQREIASNSKAARLQRSRHLKPAPVLAPDSLLLRPDLAPLFRKAQAAGEAFATLTGPLGKERGYAVAVSIAGRKETVAVIEGLDREERMLAALRRSLMLMAPIGLIAAITGGAFLADRALRPVGEMANQAERIGARTIHDRLPVANPDDELGILARSFNRVLGRLETGFEQQRQFMAEASHELRTPIAVVRGEADLALSKTDRPSAQYREALAVISDQSKRMTRTVEDLFLLARADAGQLPLATVACDLNEVAAASIRAVQTVAAERGTTVEQQVRHPCVVNGDEGLLRRLFINLLDNAIKYGTLGGQVIVTIGGPHGEPQVTVTDDGPGIPAEVQPRIFDRFYRGPDARTADPRGATGGAGLGLAIARSIAEVHGARLTLDRRPPPGTTFTLAFAAPDRRRSDSLQDKDGGPIQ